MATRRRVVGCYVEAILVNGREMWTTRIRGTKNNGGTSAHQPSESSDSSSTNNFLGGGCECKQTLCLNKRSRNHPKISTWCRPI